MYETKYISETTYKIYKIMNNLRRKLQFFTYGGEVKLTVILPEEFSIINSDTYFEISVKNSKSDFVTVEIDSNYIGQIQTPNGKGNAQFKVPSELFAIGTIYKVENGTETQISNPKQSVLKVYDAEQISEIKLYLNQTNNYFRITPTTSINSNAPSTTIKNNEFLINPITLINSSAPATTIKNNEFLINPLTSVEVTETT